MGIQKEGEEDVEEMKEGGGEHGWEKNELTFRHAGILKMICEMVSGRHLRYERPGIGDHCWRVIDL